MAYELDDILERRRLIRRAALWRFGVLVLAAVLIIGAVGRFTGQDPFRQGLGSDHIARLEVHGLIVDDRERITLIRALAENDDIKAVLVHVDSPGGTVVGSEVLYEEIRALAAVKPVVAVLGNVAASGGYIAALSADYILARGNSITGSIGVVLQWAELVELMDNLGIKMQVVKSSPLKAEPNPFTPLSEEVRRSVEELVADSYDWFVGLLMARRGFDAAQAKGLADGRVFTGRQALGLQLIDGVGDEEDARVWLETNRGLEPELEIVDYEPKRADRFSLSILFSHAILSWVFGEESPVARVWQEKMQSLERLRLDGLLSVWHPAG